MSRTIVAISAAVLLGLGVAAVPQQQCPCKAAPVPAGMAQQVQQQVASSTTQTTRVRTRIAPLRKAVVQVARVRHFPARIVSRIRHRRG
jgi:hypothetical protein